MKKVFGIIAIAATSLAFVACNQNKTTDEQADSTANKETVEKTPEALDDAVLVGVWAAQLPSADTNVPIASAITFKDGKLYDILSVQPEAKAPVEAKEQAYTIEGNIVTLADGVKLEFADGKLFILNAEGARSASTMEGEHGLYVYTKLDAAPVVEEVIEVVEPDAPKA